MNASRIARILGLTLMVGLLTPIAVYAADSSATPPTWLLVQDAANGSLVGTDDQKLTLTLKGLPLYTSAFTDRPDKLAVALPNQTLVDNWATAFASSPPNATLSYRRAGSVRPTNIVLTLTSPSYDAKKHTISYKAAVVFRTLSKDAPNAPGFAIPIPKSFGAASLFIDGLSAGQITIGNNSGFTSPTK